MLGFAALGGLPLGGFQFDDHITAEVGTFTLTGQDANLIKFVGVVAQVGTFTLSGQAAQFTRTLVADRGTFTLTGQTAGLDTAVLGGVGSFTLSGQAAGLDTSIRANVGAFTLTGQSATNIKAARVLYALSDFTVPRVEFLLGGTPLGGAPLGGDPPSQTQATTFILTGFNAGLERRFTLTADPATYTATFVSADLQFAFRPSNIRAFPRVGRGPRGFNRGGKPIAATSSGGGFKARAFGG